MSRNSNGVYTLPGLYNPVVTGTIIESNWANATMADIATALTLSLASNGVTLPTANLPMGGYRHTGAGNPVARSDYATMGYVQDGTINQITITSTAPNTLVGTMLGTNTSYATGIEVWFIYSSTQGYNDGAVTLSYITGQARSLFTSGGVNLASGDLVNGDVYRAEYNGTAFILLTEVPSSANSGLVVQSSITGWTRPTSTGVYPPITVQGGATCTIPAGSGVITQPGSGGTETNVTWPQMSGVVCNAALSARFTTFGIDITGALVQIAERPSLANYRDLIIIGVVHHQAGDGVLHAVEKTPAIFGDDGYFARDMAYLLENQLVSGGEMSAGALLQFNVATGIATRLGGDSSTVDSPNLITTGGYSAGSALYPVYIGSATSVATVTSLPVASWDNLGVITALTAAAYCAIGRIYQQGNYTYYEYGQKEYATVDEALLKLRIDESTHIRSPQLTDAVLIGYTLFRKDCADLGAAVIAGTGYFVGFGTKQWTFGSPGSLADAPSDGYYYGRENGTWQRVVGAADATINSELLIEQINDPRDHQIIENYAPYVNTWAGLNIQQRATSYVTTPYDWFNIEATLADDKVYFRSYNPATGALRFTTTFDLATGIWAFPQGITVSGGVAGGNVTGPGSSAINRIATYADASGHTLLDSGITIGNAAGKTVQTTTTDNDPTHVMLATGYGLGTTGALPLPSGTTGERPTPTAGMVRYNSTLAYNEQYVGAAWSKITTPSDLPLQGYLTGCTTSSFTDGGGFISGVTVAAGKMQVTVFATSAQILGTLSANTTKVLSRLWGVADTYGNLGGMSTTVAVAGWVRVFVISNATGSSSSIGFDTDASATNLMGNANVVAALFVCYRQVGWVYNTGSGGVILNYSQFGDDFLLSAPTRTSTLLSTAGLTSTGVAITVQCPPNTLAKVSQVLPRDGSVNNADTYAIATSAASTVVASATNYMAATLNSGLTTPSLYNQIPVSASSTIRIYASSATNTGGSLSTLVTGWTDTRGR